jgi:hypothetical protein
MSSKFVGSLDNTGFGKRGAGEGPPLCGEVMNG